MEQKRIRSMLALALAICVGLSITAPMALGVRAGKHRPLPPRVHAARVYSGPEIQAQVIQNSLGEPATWEYIEPGIYALTIPGGFPSDKTSIIMAQQNGRDENGALTDFVVYGDLLVMVYP